MLYHYNCTDFTPLLLLASHLISYYFHLLSKSHYTRCFSFFPRIIFYAPHQFVFVSLFIFVSCECIKLLKKYSLFLFSMCLGRVSYPSSLIFRVFHFRRPFPRIRLKSLDLGPEDIVTLLPLFVCCLKY